MGFINNITGGGASGGAASNSVSSKIVDELKVDVAVVETKVNSLPLDITGVKVDKNFDLILLLQTCQHQQLQIR